MFFPAVAAFLLAGAAQVRAVLQPLPPNAQVVSLKEERAWRPYRNPYAGLGRGRHLGERDRVNAYRSKPGGRRKLR